MTFLKGGRSGMSIDGNPSKNRNTKKVREALREGVRKAKEESTRLRRELVRLVFMAHPDDLPPELNRIRQTLEQLADDIERKEATVEDMKARTQTVKRKRRRKDWRADLKTFQERERSTRTRHVGPDKMPGAGYDR